MLICTYIPPALPAPPSIAGPPLPVVLVFGVQSLYTLARIPLSIPLAPLPIAGLLLPAELVVCRPCMSHLPRQLHYSLQALPCRWCW